MTKLPFDSSAPQPTHTASTQWDGAGVAPSLRDRGRLFDITIKIGTVYGDSTSTRSPFQVAMSTIGEFAELHPSHDAVTYQFPNPDGNTIEVTIRNPPEVR
jgi:hypothetical protein